MVRVTLANGTKETINQPRVENDSLLGNISNVPERVSRRAIPLDSVVRLSLYQVSAGRTILLGVGIGATIIAIAAIAAAGSSPVFSGGGGGGGTVYSCPLVYSWDGSRWRLDSGTFGGAIMPALARTDVDNLQNARSSGGRLRLRVANELNETDYLDAISVLAVDHQPGIAVAPSSDGALHTLGSLISPATAIDDRGRNALPRLRSADGWNWESALFQRDTSRLSDIRDGIHLTFPKPTGATEARLVVDGNNTPWASFMMGSLVAAHGRATPAWYDSLAANPALALATTHLLASEAFLDVQIMRHGTWRHVSYLWEAGPEITKRQVVSLDLSGTDADSVRVRLESAPMLWSIDHVAIDYGPERQVTVHELTASAAVSDQGQDVGRLLAAPDHSYYVLQTGDGAELSFQVPPVPAGQSRSYLLRSTGWYHINVPERGAPDVALLDQITQRPHGASRVIVARFNDGLRHVNGEE